MLVGGEVATAAGDVFSFALVIFETLSLERCHDAHKRRSNATALPIPHWDAVVSATDGSEWDPAVNEVLSALLRFCLVAEASVRPGMAVVADVLEAMSVLALAPPGTITTMFGAAVACGRVSVLSRLPPDAIDLEAAVDGVQSAVSVAASRGHAQMLRRLLLAAPDDVARAAAANHGTTPPIMQAVSAGSLAAVQVLIEAGADVNACVQAGASAGETAIHTAASGGYARIAALLINAGADVEAVTGDG